MSTDRPVHPVPVRPRHAASLVALRERGSGLEVLMGRRGMSAPFMPGVYVCPGGRVIADDRNPWVGEDGRPRSFDGGAGLLRLPRAALRETYEETGLVLGRPGRVDPPGERPVERAYARAGLWPALDLLAYIGRAITPTVSPTRYDTRFFVADGAHVAGDIGDSSELDDVGWHPADPEGALAMSGVTRYMLARAIAVWRGAADPAPLYSFRRGTPRPRAHWGKSDAGR
jgi:8-oxo-dGTP pyrophosphatase MutT (NUDIX family)